MIIERTKLKAVTANAELHGHNSWHAAARASRDGRIMSRMSCQACLVTCQITRHVNVQIKDVCTAGSTFYLVTDERQQEEEGGGQVVGEYCRERTTTTQQQVS